MQKTWVQAAIDVTDMDLAKKIAHMALDAGAEWLEIGTPLLYKYGHSAIGEIRKEVGKDVILVPDYKTPLAFLCAKEAKEQGADYLLVYSSYSDWANEMNLKYCKEVGLTPIFDIEVRPDDAQRHINRLASMGATHFFTRHYSSFTNADGVEVKIDNLKDVKMPEGTKLGITNDEFDDAVYCAGNGADWIIFGWVLRNPDPQSCQKWIDSIHNAK